jgi:hypothetical protein
MIKTTFIYTLIDPITYLIRYVGKADNPQKRLERHLRDLRHHKAKTHKENWIYSLTQKEQMPIVKIIAEVDEKYWKFWEIHYISLYRSLGFDLTNGTDGGDCGPKPNELSPESYAQWIAKQKARSRRHSPQTIEKLKKAAKKRGNNGNNPTKPVQIDQFNLTGDFIKRWESIKEARHSIKKGYIDGCLAGTQKTAGGFIWKKVKKD